MGACFSTINIRSHFGSMALSRLLALCQQLSLPLCWGFYHMVYLWCAFQLYCNHVFNFVFMHCMLWVSWVAQVASCRATWFLNWDHFFLPCSIDHNHVMFLNANCDDSSWVAGSICKQCVNCCHVLYFFFLRLYCDNFEQNVNGHCFLVQSSCQVFMLKSCPESFFTFTFFGYLLFLLCIVRWISFL